MNLVGYYGSDEIWIPDPISEEKIYSSHTNDYKIKKKENTDPNKWN